MIGRKLSGKSVNYKLSLGEPVTIYLNFLICKMKIIVSY